MKQERDYALMLEESMIELLMEAEEQAAEQWHHLQVWHITSGMHASNAPKYGSFTSLETTSGRPKLFYPIVKRGVKF